MSLTISLALFLAIFAGAPGIAALFENPELSWPLRIMSSMLVVNSFTSVAMARLMRCMDFKAIFIASATAVILSGIIGVACAVFGWGLWALVVQQVGYYVVLTVPLAIVAGWYPHFEFESVRARILFSFGWKLLAAGLIDAAYQGFADLLMGKSFGQHNLGLVNQGKRWPQAFGYLLDGSIQPVALSAISKIKADADDVKALMSKTLVAYAYLMFPAMAALVVCTEPFVLLLLGEQWLPCVPLMRIFCIVYAMLPLHTTNLQALSALGRSDLTLKLEVVKKTCGVALLLIAVFAVGDLYVTATTFIVVGLISLFVNAAPIARLCGYGIGEQLRDIAPAFAMSCASAALAWSVSLLQLALPVELVCQLVVACCAYVGLSALFDVRGFRFARQMFAGLAGYVAGKGGFDERSG